MIGSLLNGVFPKLTARTGSGTHICKRKHFSEPIYDSCCKCVSDPVHAAQCRRNSNVSQKLVVG